LNKKTPDYLKDLFETEKVNEKQYRFAQSVLKESLTGSTYKEPKRSKKRARRNSDDEPVDVEYEDIQAKWDSIVNDIYKESDLTKKSPAPYDKHLPRNETYRDSISKARNKLKSLNR